MKIKFKIIRTDEANHSIVVRYFTEVITEEMLRLDPNPDAPRLDDGTPAQCRTDYYINLPIPAPEGDELIEILTRQAPWQFLKAQEDILNPDVDTSMSNLQSLIGTTHTAVIDINPSPVEMPATVDKVLTDEEIMDLIKKASSGS